jgi:subtilase family serine protease
VSTLTAPSSAAAGTTVSVSDTTRNQGGETAAAAVTAYYLSANAVLDAADVLLTMRTVPSLVPGGSQSGSISLVIPGSTAGGTYYVIAKADGDNSVAESLENNNILPRIISITAASP